MGYVFVYVIDVENYIKVLNKSFSERFWFLKKKKKKFFETTFVVFCNGV